MSNVCLIQNDFFELCTQNGLHKYLVDNGLEAKMFFYDEICKHMCLH